MAVLINEQINKTEISKSDHSHELTTVIKGKCKQQREKGEAKMSKTPKPELILSHESQEQSNLHLSHSIAFKRIGRQLRKIADNLEQNVKRRHFTGQSQSLLTKSFKIVLPISILSVTIFIFLKRKL